MPAHPPTAEERSELALLKRVADPSNDADNPQVVRVLQTTMYADKEDFLTTFAPSDAAAFRAGTATPPRIATRCGTLPGLPFSADQCTVHVAPYGLAGPFVCWHGPASTVTYDGVRKGSNWNDHAPKSTFWSKEYPTWAESPLSLRPAEKLLETHQGRGGVWYAGVMAAMTRWHEGSLTSGMVAAHQLGADLGFDRPVWAADELGGVARAAGSGPSAARRCAMSFFPHVMDLESTIAFSDSVPGAHVANCMEWERQLSPNDYRRSKSEGR